MKKSNNWPFIITFLFLLTVLIAKGQKRLASREVYSNVGIGNSDSLYLLIHGSLIRDSVMKTIGLYIYGGFLPKQSIFDVSPLDTKTYPLYKYHEVLISQKAGETLASRDTIGNWDIKNPEKSLEYFYQAYIIQSQYKERADSMVILMRNILDFQNVDGTITNWRKWSEAVNKYQKFIKQKLK